jgi:hypothetical protein
MIIAAFDLATVTGVCDGATGGAPRVFTWYLDDAGGHRPAKLGMLLHLCERYFETQACDGVVYEAPLPIGMLSGAAAKNDTRIMMSEANIAFARGAIGVLEAICAKHRLPVKPINVQEARKGVLGWRANRSGIDTKTRVIDEITLLGVHVENEHEADAAVLWHYACASCNPRLAVAMTPLFRERTP